MSQSPFNQIIAAGSFTAGTALTVEVPQYYDRIIITNESTTADLYVSTNGASVTSTEGGFGAVVLPGAWRMVGNDQPKQPLVSKTAAGSTVQNTGFQGATTPNLNQLASGAPTVVSLVFPPVSDTNPGNVVLEFV